MEAKLVVSMAKTGIYPAAFKYLSDLSSTINSLKTNGIELGNERNDVYQIAVGAMPGILP